ncbi:hypothetical protein VRU48_10525 [Pedobacter sp. KR3-3]|uniref:Transglutaminase-like domain-containing protein n=1 Tax=Pedobacter albus TaxID=3113905 RepID=A0ABU7I7V6_9SPHI|nr:hypothetical protein [Pedobacter sp. KR3-3]MEE1945541.1 hypothetical protein [Pedobacter sp. KR3-3]
MKSRVQHIAYKLLIIIGLAFSFASAKSQRYSFEFYEGTFNFEADSTIDIPFQAQLTNQSVKDFYYKVNSGHYQALVQALLDYRDKYKLNDWLYYQLIRKTAQEISPKAENYSRYTLYKWFLMAKSGYDAKVAVGNDQIIFYIRNNEDIADIPFFMVDDKKYTCLNYHDYGKLFKREDTYKPVNIAIAEAKNAFSYKVTRMPEFKPEDYTEKQLAFNYKHKAYHFKVKLNNEVDKIFANYPGVDFETYFNIPLSRETYQSLIPILKENLKGMSTKNGVDYLMRFTRYAFLYENDEDNFGKEKRLSPEQTLLNKYSDCDDRAALFFFLVKEIYNLPMIAMLYPTHITMAVQFDKPVGNAIIYNGKSYTVCEPTPQQQNLKMGELSASLKNKPYEVVYHYDPLNK